MDLQKIENAVLKHFPDTNPELVKSSTRKMEHRVPRQIIIYLAATMSDIKYIRARLSERYNRNWATVDETINTVAAEVGNNKQYKSMIDKIKLDLNGTTN